MGNTIPTADDWDDAPQQETRKWVNRDDCKYCYDCDMPKKYEEFDGYSAWICPKCGW